MKHVAAVPKGFLRYQILELLSDKPLSGSEIMEEIKRRTFGMWRPSPGSIYPLLAWLHGSGYICKVPTQESGVRRYTLTDKGKQFLEEQRKIRERLVRRWKVFAPLFLCSLWLRIPSKEAEKLWEATGNFMRNFFKLCIDLETNFSEEALNEVLRILNESAREIEEVDRKLVGGKDVRRSD